MGTELGGGGAGDAGIAKKWPRTACAACSPMSGCWQGPVPPPSPTRLTEIGGDDYYVYASDGGLFEPLVDLGAEVQAGQSAARIHFHHTPWREPDLLTFKRDGAGAVQARTGALRGAAIACFIWRRIPRG